MKRLILLCVLYVFGISVYAVDVKPKSIDLELPKITFDHLEYKDDLNEFNFTLLEVGHYVAILDRTSEILLESIGYTTNVELINDVVYIYTDNYLYKVQNDKNSVILKKRKYGKRVWNCKRF